MTASKTTTDKQSPEGCVSREEVARMLHVSTEEIRRRDRLGAFKPVSRGKYGMVYYSREAIVAYAKRTGVAIVESESSTPFSAEEAKAVFAELRKGASLVDCTMNTTIHPAKVMAIAADYEKMTGCIILHFETVSEINELPLDGTFPITKASDVLSLLKASSEGMPCAICKKRSRHLCKSCAIPFVRKQLQSEKDETDAA